MFSSISAGRWSINHWWLGRNEKTVLRFGAYKDGRNTNSRFDIQLFLRQTLVTKKLYMYRVGTLGIYLKYKW